MCGKRCFNQLCLWCIIAADVTFSIALRFLGPVLVVLANGLIGLVVYIYLTLLTPRYLEPALGPVLTFFVVAFGIFLLFNILWNYWSCVLTRPGAPASQLPPLEELEAGTDFSDYGEGWRHCRKCKSGKPPRTHHCSVCRRCVMKMDHHCPWVNTCVGFHNYKFFCLFLIYLAAGCAFTAFTCAIPMLAGADLHMRRSQSMLFCFVLTISVLFALSLFIGWHAYLVATNQTTIEFYSNRMDAADARKRGERWVNPYSLGLKGNFEQVFGVQHSRLGFCMPSRKPPPGDGMNFEPNPALEMLHASPYPV